MDLSSYIGRRVVVVMHSGIVYGAAGRLTVASATCEELTLAMPKGSPVVGIPVRSIKSITPIKEEV